MKCEKCANGTFRHLIFVLQCMKCGEIQVPPKEDTKGVDFLVQRYTAPTEENAPGKDIAFVPEIVTTK